MRHPNWDPGKGPLILPMLLFDERHRMEDPARQEIRAIRSSAWRHRPRRAKFTLTGSDTGPPLSGGIILGSSTSALTGTISYSDSFADTGWTLTTGAEFDVRLTKKLGYRLSMDYDPTFLVRAIYQDPVLDSQGRLSGDDSGAQDHVRIMRASRWESFGIFAEDRAAAYVLPL